MKKTIDLLRINIEYDLKFSSRARRMRLVIYGGGDLTVVAPSGTNTDAIDHFISSNARWVIGKIGRFSGAGSPFRRGGREDYLRHKKQAGILAMERVRYFNDFYGFDIKRITVRDQKTRWGSCSKKGNLNFNYRIAFLPPNVSDYVIVHELCHLGEFNHSQRFWDLVARVMPDYSRLRKELKAGGARPPADTGKQKDRPSREKAG
jgi:hypothetical protein